MLRFFEGLVHAVNGVRHEEWKLVPLIVDSNGLLSMCVTCVVAELL